MSRGQPPSKNSVAVIGLGAEGLVALKNLVEQGFDAVGFDSNHWVGGLWHFTEQDKTSILPSTVANASKERGFFTDFPLRGTTSSYPTGAEVQQYLEDYVVHFGLGPRLRLGTTVTRVTRNDDEDGWELRFQHGGPRLFDRVVVATGVCQVPSIPELQDGHLFRGELIHSRSFKRPERFKGKSVLVVGMGNTGADTIDSLCGHAKEIYLSHRRGAIVLPRNLDGVPFDHRITLRKVRIVSWLLSHVPSTGERVMDRDIHRVQRSAFGDVSPETGITPCPSIRNSIPIVSDSLVPNLRSGVSRSVPEIKRAAGSQEIELADGFILQVDAIIWCTGYKSNFDLLEPAVDPARTPTPEWAAQPGSNGRPLPRLYQNVLSLDYPHSLAFMGCNALITRALPLNDLASMAIAQIWKGNSPLPRREDMIGQVEEEHARLCSLAAEASVDPSYVREGEWLAWANEMAGTGLTEHLGWGFRSWHFWLCDAKMHRLLMDGIYSPHIYRLFDVGKRKPWEGAREELARLNREAPRRQTKRQSDG